MAFHAVCAPPTPVLSQLRQTVDKLDRRRELRGDGPHSGFFPGTPAQRFAALVAAHDLGGAMALAVS
jgi:hypothetical protein